MSRQRESKKRRTNKATRVESTKPTRRVATPSAPTRTKPAKKVPPAKQHQRTSRAVGRPLAFDTAAGRSKRQRTRRTSKTSIDAAAPPSVGVEREPGTSRTVPLPEVSPDASRGTSRKALHDVGVAVIAEAPTAAAAVTRAKTGAHPPHPKCPACSRALYKSMLPKAVKKTDPWAFCRNAACSRHGEDQSAAGQLPEASPGGAPMAKPAEGSATPESRP